MTVHTATAIIDFSALVNNLKVIKKLAPSSKVLAVLKANAYGHGLVRIAKALLQNNSNNNSNGSNESAGQVDAFGVARLDEALVLRAAGIVHPIVLLEGFFSVDDLPILSKNNLQTIVHNTEQLAAISEANLDQPLKVWLKIDTGMHRLGIDADQFTHFYSTLKASENVQPEIILMSHLACADDVNSSTTTEQVALFEEITEQVTEGTSAEKSMANSAGICAWPNSHYQWLRPGLMLYGVSPMQQFDKTLNIQPVLTLQSSLIAVRNLAKGEKVGYGGTWISTQATTIGVVAIGYGDGYPRHATNGTPVLINGRKVPLVGRVSMDMITVDLGANATDKVGDIVTLWGKGLPVEEIADYATTIPYELLCNITSRVKMIETA